MPGDAQIGSVLRDLRQARDLSLTGVARDIGCDKSLLSKIEAGTRTIHVSLAQRLDTVYGTGGVVAALARPARTAALGPSAADMLMVDPPCEAPPMLIPRREVLASLALGATTGPFLARLVRALDTVAADTATLRSFDHAYSGFQTAARTVAPHQLIDAMTGHVTALDVLRRRADRTVRAAMFRTQARYAESLSWLAEESGDLTAATYWIDRASHWGQAAGWHDISAYGHVRRSMIALSATDDGARAVDNAAIAHEMTGATPRIRGLAAKQMAFGYALCGDSTASSRALDHAMELLSQPTRPADDLLGQRSVLDDHLFTIFHSTCRIYLGAGRDVVTDLEPRLGFLTEASPRTATITRAKLARAYADAGQPDEAAATAHTTLDAIHRIGSRSALAELRRALPVLGRWHRRHDVRAVIDRLTSNASTS